MPASVPLPSWLLLACAVGAGAASMSIEIVAGRALTPHVGGTVYTWGALIGAFMTGMSVGYDAGGRLADRWPHPLMLASLLLGAAATTAVVPMFATGLMTSLAHHIEDLRYAALIGALILTGPPAALLAATGPYCLKLSLADPRTAGRIAGRLSACGAAGSIAGTIGTSFWLIPLMGVKSMLLMLALGCLLLAAVVGAVALRRCAPAGSVVEA